MLNLDGGESDYALFGMVLLQWGHIEATLINILLRLTQPLFYTYAKNNLPGAFSGQVKAAQRLYRAIPQMANLTDDACTLLDTLLPLHKARSIIIHEYYQGRMGDDRFMFGIFERQQGPRRPRMINKAHYFTQGQIVQLSSGIEARRVELESLSYDTFRIPLPNANRAAGRHAGSI